MIVEGGNSFNGGTITGGIRFDGDASLENDGTIDGIEDSRFANSRGAALLNNGKIDRLSNVTVTVCLKTLRAPCLSKTI